MKSQTNNSKSLDLKIAYVGGGSRLWARRLMVDLALCPDLSGLVALYDIDLESARLNERLGNWLHGQPGAASHWQYEATESLERALTGADFVVVSIQPGTLQCMAEEIAIAEQYGLWFPVGDTVGATGLVRGLRSATIYIDLAHQIADHCPDAWIINYTNPMAVCTRTLTKVEPGLKAFGCCHEVFSTQSLLAGLAAEHRGHAVERRRLRTTVTGVNHFTFITDAHYRDLNLLALLRRRLEEPGVRRAYTRAEVEARSDYFQDHHQVKFALFERLGILPAAGDRHLVEFLPGFTRSPDELYRWGLLRTPVSYRLARWENAPQDTRALIEGRKPLVLERSGEEGVELIQALLGMGDLVTNVNVENRGQIANLPLGAVVETNARFTRNEVTPLSAGPLPPGVHGLVAKHAANQELIVEAALSRNRELAFQAILNDPASSLPVDEAWAMFNAMLRAGREWLPGWQFE